MFFLSVAYAFDKFWTDWVLDFMKASYISLDGFRLLALISTSNT